jgi:hypothetical protein
MNNQAVAFTDSEQKITVAFGLDPESDVLWNWISSLWKTFLFRQRIHTASVHFLITVMRH